MTNDAAGNVTATFEVFGLRPSRPIKISALANGAPVSTTLQVTGLRVSEVVYDVVDEDDGFEWVKLENVSSVAIDLSNYSIGVGQLDYTFTTVDLTGSLKSNNCFVVGGPMSSRRNGSPDYEQEVNFSPDLPDEPGQAKGFGIFDVSAADIDSDTVPVDSMLVGVDNEAGLLGSEGTVASPHCTDIAEGSSAVRSLDDSFCIERPEPRPDLCTRLVSVRGVDGSIDATN